MDELNASSIKSMGFGFCYKRLWKDRRLPIEAKAIYDYIASYAGAGNTAFPGWKLICFDLMISKTRYYKFFKYLKAYGYITVTQKKNPDFTFSHNIFKLEDYPELNEDAELIKELTVDKSDSSNLGNGENTPIPQIPETEIPETENEESNSNSDKSILFISIWDMAKEKLNKLLPEHTYNDFITTLQPFSYEDNVFTLLCPDEWLKTIIEMRYMDKIHMVLSEVSKLHNINDFQILIKV